MIYFVRKHLYSCLKTNCRPFYCIWYGRRTDTWKKTRYFSSAIAGTLCAYFICQIIFASFIFPSKWERGFLSLTIIMMSCGFIFTDSVKCVTYLIFIALMGKSGRSYLRALCFAFVISGPIENLASNAGEIVRVFSCSKMLTFNLTRTRFDLMTKPFQKTLSHMKDDIKEVQQTFNELQNVTQAIHQEILEDDPPLTEDDIETLSSIENIDRGDSEIISVYNLPMRMKTSPQHVAHKRRSDPDIPAITPYSAEYVADRYKNKFRKRCIQQLDSGKVRCRKAFANSLQKCREKMPVILRTFICWPFKIDFMCKINILGDPDKICNPSDAITDDFGHTYVDLVNTEQRLYQNNSDVKVHYTILSPETMPELQSAKETAKSVAREFSTRKRIFDHVLTLLQQLLAFMLFKVFFACLSYHKRYNNDIDHDNIYISEYFKRIDQERKTQGKSALLPLKKYERTNLIDVANVWQRTREESRAVAFHLLQFSLEIVTGLFFLFLDYVIVTVLLVIRKNSEMSFVQEGEHTIRFSIQGSGLIARLLRSTMRNFNMHEKVSTYMTNEPCLPKPSVLPESFYLKLFSLYGAVIILIHQSATFLRLRRLICSYFYRKREKRRILYLYNCLLKQRRSMKETMLKQAKFNYANRKIRLNANIFLKLRLHWPEYFNWFLRFNAGRRKCVICDDFENDHFVICNSPHCGVSYCEGCWLDMGNECLVCNDSISAEIILNFSDFFEEFSFV